MKKIAFVLLILVAICLLISCGKQTASGEEKLADVRFDSFAVGFGKADITPDPDSKIGILGNNDHTTRLSEGVLEPLGVACIAFTDTDNTTVLLYSADLHTSDSEVVKAIREGIEAQTGVPGNHVQFTVTHIHTGPDTGSTASGPVRENNKMIVERCVQAGVDALKTRKPAQMYTTFTRPENLLFHNHFLLEDGSYNGWRYEIDQSKVIGRMEAADNLFQMVKFTREGEKDIIMVNWPAHIRNGMSAEYYNYLNGDFSAVMRRVLLEKADCESLYIYNGCGDVLPETVIQKDNITENYLDYGELLADIIIENDKNFQLAETGKIQYLENNYVLPFPDQERAYPLYAFGFGDFGCVTIPWKPMQVNLMAVRENSPYKMTFYSGVANGSNFGAYLPDEKKTTYPSYQNGTWFTPKGTAEVVETELIRMLNEIFEKSGQTVKDKGEGYIMDHSPKTDGISYTIDKGAAPKEVNNGHYQVMTTQRLLLVQDKALADEIVKYDTVKLLFAENNMVVGIYEE